VSRRWVGYTTQLGIYMHGRAATFGVVPRRSGSEYFWGLATFEVVGSLAEVLLQLTGASVCLSGYWICSESAAADLRRL
jgi:hypothetical protein